MIDTGHDVFTDDVDVIIAVRSSVLVPKSDDMTQLVNDDAELVAILANGNGLCSVTTFTDERAASKR